MLHFLYSYSFFPAAELVALAGGKEKYIPVMGKEFSLIRNPRNKLIAFHIRLGFMALWVVA